MCGAKKLKVILVLCYILSLFPDLSEKFLAFFEDNQQNYSIEVNNFVSSSLPQSRKVCLPSSVVWFAILLDICFCAMLEHQMLKCQWAVFSWLYLGLRELCPSSCNNKNIRILRMFADRHQVCKYCRYGWLFQFQNHYLFYLITVIYICDSQILKENVLDVCQFCLRGSLDVENASHPDLLWAAVVTQLENGEVALKTVCS